MPLVQCINTNTIGKCRSRVPSAAKQETCNCPRCCLRALLRPFFAIQLQTALSHTAAALHAATRCKTSSPARSKKTRARQQHRPRQRAESSHAAPRTEKLIPHSSSTERGNALNRTQPRTQKKNCASQQRVHARYLVTAILRPAVL
jgi:hypothetical protein